MKIPRVVIAAPRSGSGKTLITTALIKALKLNNKKVAGFKCGPDYIDPMFHKKVLGIPSKNLDLYFTDEEKTRELFIRKNSSEISIIEGVMGLYDGLAGISSEASTYSLASALKAPVILVIDAHGMGVSVMAEIAGFLSMDNEKLIKGLILNRMSKSYFETLKPVIEEKFNIPVLGCFPVNKELKLESRHLGLVLPDEIKELDSMTTLAAKAFTENIDLEKIISIAEEACELEVNIKEEIKVEKKARIAVARDEAFCFIYEDNLSLIEANGGEIVFFSPLKDKALPENIDALILYGGYPELYARELSENKEMCEAIKNAIEGELPYLAECGGFMYLHDTIVTKEGEEYPMVGALEGKSYYTGKLVRFGYAAFKEKDALFMGTDEEIRGHEFHYYDSTNNGEDFVASKPITNRSWDCIHKTDKSIAGFAHLYYESNPDFIKNFMGNIPKHTKYNHSY